MLQKGNITDMANLAINEVRNITDLAVKGSISLAAKAYRTQY